VWNIACISNNIISTKIFSAYNYDSRNYDDEYDDYAPKSNYQPYGGGSGKKLNSYMKFLNTR